MRGAGGGQGEGGWDAQGQGDCLVQMSIAQHVRKENHREQGGSMCVVVVG